jgi:hypothetical protein
MKKLIAMTALACISAAAMATPAAAWTEVARRVVTDRMDVDVVVLPGWRRYDEIKLCVKRNPVRFVDVDVNFANGGHQDISVRSRINPGDCTRNIDLRGYNRDITSIKLLYEETSWGRHKTATVVLWAR